MSKRATALQILLIFVFPFLIFFFLPAAEEKEWVHALIHLSIWIFSLAVLVVVWYEKWSWKELGIRMDNLRQAILPYFIFTILGLLFIFSFAEYLNRTPAPNWWTYSHLQYGFILTSFFQEFIFRAFLMKKLQILFKTPLVVISINALLFALAHLILPDALLLFPLGIISGFAFATIYYFFPNLILIALAHMILNFFAVLHCFFAVQVQC